MDKSGALEIDLRGQRIERIGVVSDTHGWIDPRILDCLGDCDLVIHAGDVCGTAILEAIAGSRPALQAVAGNNDRIGDYVTDSGRMLTLHEILHLRLDDVVIAVEHGHRHDWRKPPHASLRAAHPKADMIIYGHTHKLVCDQSERPWVLNPGAAGRTRTGGGPSWICLQHETGAGWRATPERWPEAA